MKTATNEKPIPFSAPMVRAILDGLKTQTRRIAKLTESGRVKEPGSHRNWHLGDPECVKACPYGQPGDRLYVREKFLPCKVGGPASIADATYVCFEDGAQQFRNGKTYDGTTSFGKLNWPTWAKWRPSIHMPRWASRITLEITGVRVERLNDISYDDAVAEGINPDSDTDHEYANRSTIENFAALWESINGNGSWAANPWVWVIDFRRIKP